MSELPDATELLPLFVLYHADCLDGFGAAYVAANWCKEHETLYSLVPCVHGKPFPELPPDAQIRVFDFSWKRDEMLKAFEKHRYLKVFDHHTTAQKELENLPHCTFDMNKSGAQLAWQHFYGNEPYPWWVAYIADWDLWRHQLVGCTDFHAWLGSYPKTETAWDKLFKDDKQSLGTPSVGVGLYLQQVVFPQGRAINRVLDMMIEEHFSRRSSVTFWPAHSERDGLPVQLDFSWTHCNETRIVSKLGERLAQISRSQVGLCVFPDGNYSFRSTPDGPNVGTIAHAFGGGGHAHAAGCPGDPFRLLK